MKLFLAPLLISLLAGVPVEGERRMTKGGSKIDDAVGAIFTMNNGYLAPDDFETAGLFAPVFIRGFQPNELVMYHRYEDGTFETYGKFPTGGEGFGPPVCSNSIISVDNYVFVCNMISSSVTMFEVNRYGAVRLDIVDTGGPNPISLAYNNGILYVLNGAFNDDSGLVEPEGVPSITAFRVENGSMTPIPRFTRELTDWEDEGGAELEITPDGRYLLVSLAGISDQSFATNNAALLVYRLNDAGRPSPEPVDVMQENLDWLIGVAVDEFEDNTFLYAGNLLDGSISSYRLKPNGQVKVASDPVVGTPLGGDSALCWVEMYGRYIYTSNFSDNTISSFVVDRSTGEIEVLEEVAADLSMVSDAFGALDMKIIDGYLYVVDFQDFLLIGYNIESDGTLTVITDGEGTPLAELGGSTGIAFVDF